MGTVGNPTPVISVLNMQSAIVTDIKLHRDTVVVQ